MKWVPDPDSPIQINWIDDQDLIYAYILRHEDVENLYWTALFFLSEIDKWFTLTHIFLTEDEAKTAAMVAFAKHRLTT